MKTTIQIQKETLKKLQLKKIEMEYKLKRKLTSYDEMILRLIDEK